MTSIGLPTVSFSIDGTRIELVGLNLTVVKATLLPSLGKLATVGVESVVVAQHKRDSPWHWVVLVMCDGQTREASTMNDAVVDESLPLSSQALLLAAALDQLAETLVR